METGHGQITSATLRLSSLGICEAWINGIAVSDAVLTPGWTSYEWRLHYVEHDVLKLLDSQSTISIVVGNGWWHGRLGWVKTEKYGSEIAAYADLRIRFADGYEQQIVTDETWTAGPSPILSDDIYDGQTIDGMRVVAQESDLACSDIESVPVQTVGYEGKLSLDPAPPVKRIREIGPTKVWQNDAGSILIDFGENIVGWVRLSIQGEPGDEVLIRHAEVLEHGALAREPLRSAEATDRYILSGRNDVFEPTFTFHGFRYVEIIGWVVGVEEITAENVVAVVISSDMKRIGTFESSVPELNLFHENVVRGMRGNFVDIPTDCPQRDERLGWTGDIAAFAPTASFLFDVRSFLGDWLRDLALEQSHHNGIVPNVVPDVLKYSSPDHDGIASTEATAFWSDAAVWVPWAIWNAYGEKSVLEEALPSMLLHGRRVRTLLSPNGIWESGFQFGDWLDPDAPAQHPENAKANKYVVATAAAFHTADLICKAAEILGLTAEMNEFAILGERIRAGFKDAFIQDKRILSDCATVYALAICFGLLNDDEEIWAGKRLAELVSESDYKISTGFAGTPHVTEALTRTGHVEDAYRLLLQTECPSWLYPVTMGATTIWERWDSMLPDGSINPGDMTSFNHYALGAVADWMHRVIGGLAPLEPGYARILIAPRIGDGIDWARTTLETPHGLASVSWICDQDCVKLDINVPPGTSALVSWPEVEPWELEEGHHHLELPKQCRL